MFEISMIVADNRAGTPGGLQRGGDAITTLWQDGSEGYHERTLHTSNHPDVFPIDVVRWLIGEAVGESSYVWVDNTARMSCQEWWEHANAHAHYEQVMQQPEAWSEQQRDSARRDYQLALLAYTAHIQISR